MIVASIDSAVLKLYPDARLFAVVANKCSVIAPQPCTPEMVPAVIGALPPEAIAEHPVLAAWRQIYAAQGLKPSQYRCSLEALLRRLTKGQAVQTNVPAVDLYNGSSVTTLAPMGAYDVAKLSDQPIVLRFCQPASDSFQPIGGDAKDFPLGEKVIVYAQGDTVLCWAVNHRDCRTCQVDAASDRVIFFAEGLTADQAERAEAAIVMLRSKLLDFGAEPGEILGSTSAGELAYQAA